MYLYTFANWFKFRVLFLLCICIAWWVLPMLLKRYRIVRLQLFVYKKVKIIFFNYGNNKKKKKSGRNIVRVWHIKKENMYNWHTSVFLKRFGTENVFPYSVCHFKRLHALVFMSTKIVVVFTTRLLFTSFFFIFKLAFFLTLKANQKKKRRKNFVETVAWDLNRINLSFLFFVQTFFFFLHTCQPFLLKTNETDTVVGRTKAKPVDGTGRTVRLERNSIFRKTIRWLVTRRTSENPTKRISFFSLPPVSHLSSTSLFLRFKPDVPRKVYRTYGVHINCLPRHETNTAVAYCTNKNRTVCWNVCSSSTVKNTRIFRPDFDGRVAVGVLPICRRTSKIELINVRRNLMKKTFWFL